MADLQSMTLQERMVTILNAEHSLSYGLYDLSFQEACNKWLIETGTVDSVDYSGIGINKYTPEEAFAIIRHKIDLRSETLDELVSELGSYYPIHKYTATEALNKKNAVLVPYSLSFDGNDNYVDLSGFFRISDYTAGTVALWFKADNADVGSNDEHIFSARDQTGTNSKCSIALIDNGKIEIALGSGSNKISDISYSADTWTHIAITWKDSDGSGGTGIAYVNGTAHGTTHGSIDSAAGNGGKKLTLGGYAITATNNNYDGKIDEVAIFDKELTQAEITSLYAADPQNAGDAVGITNLIGYWKLDEGTGEPQDISGNDNHGTISGATWTVH
jgi:hypothetical protein